MTKPDPLAKLLLIGEQMSNLCFNWSQQNRFTDHERKMLRELCSNWDYFQRAHRAEARAISPKRPATKARKATK